MATELTELAQLAADNLRRERDNAAVQTFIDDWADKAELDAALVAAVQEVDVLSEPRTWEDVVSFGPAAVIGFVSKKSPRDDEEVVFS
jgi:hypothetical protein